MITRLYANNFRCLVAFKAEFDSFGVLCGPNGAGKSSVFDAVRLIRSLATGDAYLGGPNERDIPRLEFTKWLESRVQEFELGVTSEWAFLRIPAAYRASRQPRETTDRAGAGHVRQEEPL